MEDLLTLKELIEAGKVTPVIDRTYPLSETPEATWSRAAIARVAPVNRDVQCLPSGACYFYARIGGTSVSAANASGVAALIVSQKGDFTDANEGSHLSPTAVESILQSTANNQPCPEPKTVVYGPPPVVTIPPFPPAVSEATCTGDAGYNSFFGKGIVDALKAVSV